MERRDAEVFRRTYAEHYGAVRRYLLSRAPASEVDDLTSETFEIAWRRAERMPDHALPWLLNVAGKVAANRRRSAERAEELAQRLTAVAVLDGQGMEADAERRMERIAVLRALATLTSRDRELMLLHLWDDLRPREIAAVLEISPVTVRARLSRARRRLQQALQAELAYAGVAPPSLFELEGTRS